MKVPGVCSRHIVPVAISHVNNLFCHPEVCRVLILNPFNYTCWVSSSIFISWATVDTYHYENQDCSKLRFDTYSDIVLLQKTPNPKPKLKIKKQPKRKEEWENKGCLKTHYDSLCEFSYITLNNLYKFQWSSLILSSGTRISASHKQLSFPLR